MFLSHTLISFDSGYHYADKALSYAMGLSSPSSPNPALKTSDWKELFDVIICASSKPSFFSSKKPLRQWNTEFDRPLPNPVNSINPGEVYVHGSVHALQKLKTWSDAEILYVGDNLGADLVEAKKRFGWHTAGIINELDREVDIQSDELFNELHYLRSTLRNMLTDLQLAMFSSYEEIASQNVPFTKVIMNEDHPSSSESVKGNENLHNYAKHIAGGSLQYNENHELIKLIEDELHSINTELSLLFNPQFGSMFRTDGHTSLYAYAIRRYADLYMSEVGHFLHYSPTHRFYPPHSLHMVSKLIFFNDHLILFPSTSTVGP